MKKSELLKYVLAGLDDAGSEYLCDRIRRAVRILSYSRGYTFFSYKESPLYKLGKSMTDWISDNIEHKFSVGFWLKSKGYALDYDDDSEEMKEYRRLWLKDMIEYWESKGE